MYSPPSLPSCPPWADRGGNLQPGFLRWPLTDIPPSAKDAQRGRGVTPTASWWPTRSLRWDAGDPVTLPPGSGVDHHGLPWPQLHPRGLPVRRRSRPLPPRPQRRCFPFSFFTAATRVSVHTVANVSACVSGVQGSAGGGSTLAFLNKVTSFKLH